MTSKKNISISTIEKIIVNWATPFEVPYNHLVNKYIKKDEYQHPNLQHRFSRVSKGRMILYKKILVEKQINKGKIPVETIERDKYKACGITRLMLAYLRKV